MTVDDATCTLTATGRHSITVADAACTKTGQFAISIQRLNDPVGCGAALSYGTVGTLGLLTATGDSECHRLTVGAGDRVRVQTQAVASGRRRGRSRCDPRQVPVRDQQRPPTCTATVDGEYTVLIDSPQPGGYGVSAQRLGNPVGCTSVFANNGPATSTVFAAGMTRCYRFDGDVGTRLRARVVATGGALDPLTEVLRPDGTTL